MEKGEILECNKQVNSTFEYVRENTDPNYPSDWFWAKCIKSDDAPHRLGKEYVFPPDYFETEGINQLEHEQVK